MKPKSLFGSALAMIFAAGMSLAIAQTPPPSTSKPDQNGKQEPSAKNTADTPGSAGVLVNGALAVPGASTDTPTVPAKFSQKNDASDHLLILGYTFKDLTDAQRRAVYQAVKGKSDTPKAADANPQIGDALPGTLATDALPAEVIAQVPEMDRYRAAISGDKVLVINPVNMVVVAVFAAS